VALSPRKIAATAACIPAGIDGGHGDTHQCAWLEEEDKMEILQKKPQDFGVFLILKTVQILHYFVIQTFFKNL
jgi:hypothetical protein